MCIGTYVKHIWMDTQDGHSTFLSWGESELPKEEINRICFASLSYKENSEGCDNEVDSETTSAGGRC